MYCTKFHNSVTLISFIAVCMTTVFATKGNQQPIAGKNSGNHTMDTSTSAPGTGGGGGGGGGFGGGSSNKEEKHLIICDKTNYSVVLGNILPYAFMNAGSGDVHGPVSAVLEASMERCCGQAVTLKVTRIVRRQREVEEHLSTEDMAFPVVKTSLLIHSGASEGYVFLPLLETIGSAILVDSNKEPPSVVGQSLLACWPLAVIVVTSAGLAGIAIWILDRNSNSSDFPYSYFRGGWEGTWWAFVTMTTVGYGDRAPKSAAARIFGLVWMYVGIILMSILTATLTTALSAEQINQVQVELRGANIAVLSGSMEEMLALREGSNPYAYEKLSEVLEAVKNQTTIAALADINLVMHKGGDIYEEGIRILRNVYNPSAIGIILVNQTKELESCLSRQVSLAQFRAYDNLVSSRHSLPASDQNVAAESTARVMDSLTYICVGLTVLWVLVTVGCLMWHFLYFKQRQQVQGNQVSSLQQIEPIPKKTTPE